MNHDGTPITHEQFLAMLEAQQYRCAICGTSIDHTSPLDHDHETGEPRGVLCHPCNMALGWLEPHIGQVQAYLQLATEGEEASSLSISEQALRDLRREQRIE